MNENEVAGFTACAVQDDSIIWSYAQGFADIEKGVPMNINSRIKPQITT